MSRIGNIRITVAPILFGSIVTALLAKLPGYFLVVGFVAIVAIDTYSRSNGDMNKPGKQQCDLKDSALKRLANKTPAKKNSSPHEPRRLTPPCSSKTIEEQIQEMLDRVRPKARDVSAVRGLAKSIDKIISDELSIDGAVSAYACTSPFTLNATGKLEPEISIVITVDLAKYHAHLMQNRTDSSCTVESSSKNILRRVNKRLSKHDFKAVSCTFAEHERLILNAPIGWGKLQRRACIQLLVNDPLPSRGAKLVEFCEGFQPMAADLILMIQQWVRWRKICLVSKGDLSLYVWTNLVIFYVQNKGLLPPYKDKNRKVRVLPQNCLSMRAYLFRGFFSFYTKDFDFNTEVVSILTGGRSSRKCPSRASVCIEDPYDAEHTPADNVVVERINTFKRELQRADRLCSSCTDLNNLLAGSVHVK